MHLRPLVEQVLDFWKGRVGLTGDLVTLEVRVKGAVA